MQSTKYDYIIVGSGLFGAVFAQQAKEAGKSVLVLERRNHIGGNCYTENYKDSNIILHKYGTHIFHTNDMTIWNYVNRFSSFNRYQHRVLTTHKGKVYSMPINLGTINQFYDIGLKPGEVEVFIKSKINKQVQDTKNLEEKAISLIGKDLYDAFIKGYTTKQWGCDPKLLPANIITRLPVRSSYNDSYFDDIYQGIPEDGYTKIFEKMLSGIEVKLNIDFFNEKESWLNKCNKLVYTGPIDRFFDYKYGYLNWRSVRFETEEINTRDYQGTSVMNYADMDIPFTRIHEPKHLHPEKKFDPNRTVIMKEYSQINNDEPYYPVNFDDDASKLKKYQAEQRNMASVIFGGRLAEYKYYDMHQVIGDALTTAKRELSIINN